MKITCDWSLLSVEMPKLWWVFIQRACEIRGRSSDYMIDMNLQVIGNEFTELICVEVDELRHIPEGMVGLTIPSQRYAYLKHEGPVEEIWKSFGELQNWIAEAGHTKDPLDFKMDYCPKYQTSPHELFQKIVD